MVKRLSSDFFHQQCVDENVICIMIIIDHDEDFGYLYGGGDGEYEYTSIYTLP